MWHGSRRFQELALAVVSSVACALLLSACGGETPAAPAAASGAAPSPGTTIEGTFDVGGHKLYLRCSGQGSPTVVYLHGYIHDPSGGGSRNAGSIPALLGAKHQVCVYDRANVGRSEQVKGPLTGRDSVKDLHELLRAANISPPYLLLGASWGGTTSLMYAAIHPSDVAGMVLLDPPLPTSNELDKRFLPPEDRLGRDDWKNSTEQVDQYTTCEQALKLLKGEQRIPVTFVALKHQDLDPSWPVVEMTAAIRKDQRELMHRFPGGKIVVVDVPHYMEPVIPERIAGWVEEVAEEIH